jgi:phosphoribosylformylglycinamidine synthase PurS subunit
MAATFAQTAADFNPAYALVVKKSCNNRWWGMREIHGGNTAPDTHNFLARFRRFLSATFSVARMKAKIIITPKKAVLDPQGKTVQTALAHMGYTGVTGVHIGKYIEIDLAPGTDKAAAQKALNDAAYKLLSNPVIEDYKLEISE